MVTMKEVAERLGLSRAAVSHVLNGRADRFRIKPETQRKILAAAKELGFHRNEAARTMVTGQTRIVCMLVKSLSAEYYSMSAEGVLSEANKAGMFLKMATWTSVVEFEETLRRTMELQPLGLICRGLLKPEVDILGREMQLNPLPIVLMDDYPGSGAWAATVCTDSLMGFRLVLSRLHELGHREVGYLSCPLDSACFSRSRFELFKQAAKEVGVAFDERNLWCIDIESIDELAEKLAANQDNRLHAVVTPADGHAYRLVKSLEKRGVRIPDDISVTGYGNNPVSRYGTPPLTTVSEPYIDTGKVAFTVLTEMIDRGRQQISPASFNKIMPVELVRGKTIAQPCAKNKRRSSNAVRH